YREHPEEGSRFLTAVVPLALPFSIVLTLLGLSTLAAALARRTYLSYVLWIVLLVPSFIIVNRATLILAPYRSQRDAAAIITREWQDDAHVVVDGLYDDAMSITFYTRRPTYLLGPNSGDLAFGFRRTSGSPLLLTSEQFDTWWSSAAPVFLLTDRRPFPSGSRVLLERPRFSLVTNQPPTPASTSSPNISNERRGWDLTWTSRGAEVVRADHRQRLADRVHFESPPEGTHAPEPRVAAAGDIGRATAEMACRSDQRGGTAVSGRPDQVVVNSTTFPPRSTRTRTSRPGGWSRMALTAVIRSSSARISTPCAARTMSPPSTIWCPSIVAERSPPNSPRRSASDSLTTVLTR